MTNIPIIDKTKQKNDFNINNSNWQIAHSSKSSNKGKWNQWIFALKPVTNSLRH